MELFQRGGIWYHDFRVNGKRDKRSTGQRTKTAAQAVAYRRLQEARGEVKPEAKPLPTLDSLLTDLIIHLGMTSLAAASQRYYANGSRLLRETAIANKRIDLIVTADASELDFPHSGSNANCALRTLSRALSYAVDLKLLQARPKIKPRKERQREGTISDALEKSILEHAQQPFRDVFLVIQDAGMRPDEVIRMRWEDVLWDQNVIFVRSGKTAKARRHVPLSQRVKDALKARANGSEIPWVFASKRKGRSGERGHIWPTSVNDEWQRLRALLHIPEDLVLYSGRHTFATDLLDRSGGNIALVGKVLGHSSITTTQRYLHPSLSGVAALVDARNAGKMNGPSLGPSAICGLDQEDGKALIQ